eukprot:581252-Pelagomonas_calceolata.AAC.2
MVLMSREQRVTRGTVDIRAVCGIHFLEAVRRGHLITVDALTPNQVLFSFSKSSARPPISAPHFPPERPVLSRAWLKFCNNRRHPRVLCVLFKRVA